MNATPRPFRDRFPAWASASPVPSTIDFWKGTFRRSWPALGLHAWVQEATFDKGRLLVGPIGSPFADDTY